MSNFTETFDWEKLGSYKGGNRLISNPKIQGQDQNTICFSHEDYAQDLFNLYTNKDHKIIRKDLQVGDVVKIVDIFETKRGTIALELEGGLQVDIDLSREKKFAHVFGHDDIKSFGAALIEEANKKNFLESGLAAYVVEVDPIKISLWQGYILKTRNEFIREIQNPTRAYVAKVLEANKGGYFVEVQGVEAFMPGSLAAPNKIADFRTLLGKDVIVMIEDYIKEMNSFIVSHKKYIEHVMPQRIAEMDLDKKYSGTVTGTSKYGIFIEFEEIFTGLLHVSKMKPDTTAEFKARQFTAGDTMDFYINEITKDNRIILTEESPVERRGKITDFIESYGEKVIEANVAAVMNFGVIVNFEEISGLIPNKEFRRKKIFTNSLTNRDTISVLFSELNDDKIIFKLPKE